MSKNVSVYLTDRTFSSVRGKQPLSARLNQIVDRYLEAVAADGETVRRAFDDTEWTAMVDAWALIAFDKPPALAARLALVRAVSDPGLVAKLEDMPSGDFFILVELLELAEFEASVKAAEAPATQS